jgi:hypothetical protein
MTNPTNPQPLSRRRITTPAQRAALQEKQAAEYHAWLEATCDQRERQRQQKIDEETAWLMNR